MFSDVKSCNPERILEMCVAKDSIIPLQIVLAFESICKVLMKLKEKFTYSKWNRSEYCDSKFYIGFKGK